MSTRYEEYKDRVHFKGNTKREYVKTKVKESISSLIEDSQYGFTISVYHKNSKNYTDHEVAILSTKTTQEYEAANIIAPLEVGLEKGTLFNWDSNDWIVLKKMFRPDQPGFNGIAYRCTGDLKWIDKDTKELFIQPAYIRSGRITNALGVTPDVNRVFDNIVMHDTDWNMMAATQRNLDFHPEMRFILNGQAYRVTNVDNVSIDDVSILSLVDDKLLDTDDRINGIAYADVYEYTIHNKLTEDLKLYAGDITEIPIVVLKDGVTVDEDYVLESKDPSIVEVNGKKIISRGLGSTEIIVSLSKNKTIFTVIPVEVGEEHVPQEAKIYIDGNDYIEWNTSEEYKLSNGSSASFEVDCLSKIRKTIDYINPTEEGSEGVKISIKDKYSGTFVITAMTEQGLVEKTVYIRTV
ncbi:MAG: hypothetical protein KBT03_05565 [Bacteroidales bacterium]|nr:hypothetical protein [Candidatus Scybalousia scybalohippi]